ncbi:Uncharacterised protein [Burkholderia pseudomallei]|nr:hypothetical protein DP49_6484 [Burkholderia pseudomallei]KOS78774.1 putative ABC transporter, ATP-binding domain protein [Burkholderia mallei]KOT17946.1 putative ABC transporter, ATP-binding domain protein [Burkholderia mallei]KOT25819.1 ABC transporter, ATP-binding domain protein [Burkholderia mallei]CAJ8686585.1 Uncharacterised protein [Burkholderia pseudomallei]
MSSASRTFASAAPAWRSTNPYAPSGSANCSTYVCSSMKSPSVIRPAAMSRTHSTNIAAMPSAMMPYWQAAARVSSHDRRQSTSSRAPARAPT